MTGPRLDPAPNLAPSGVIQNPGIGQILGGGLSNLAQFLMQQHQQQQEQQARQQQLALQQQQVDLQRSSQSFTQQQARDKAASEAAQQAQQASDQGQFGQIIQGMQPQPGQQVNVPLSPDYLGAQPSSTVTTPPTQPSFADATGKVDPAVVARFLASPTYKAWSEANKGTVVGPDATFMGPQGQVIGIGASAPKKPPEASEVALDRLGLNRSLDGPALLALGTDHGRFPQGALKAFSDMVRSGNTEKVQQTPVQASESAFSKAVSGKSGEDLAAETGTLRKLQGQLAGFAAMETILKQGQIHAGLGSDMFQKLGQIAVKLGWASPEEVATVNNTQFYGNLVARGMANSVKEFASRGLTVGDTPFVEAANAAAKSGNTDALLRAVRFGSKAIRGALADHNEIINASKDLAPGVAAYNRLDASGGLPATKTFKDANGQSVVGVLDERTGHYRGLVNGQTGFVDGYDPNKEP